MMFLCSFPFYFLTVFAVSFVLLVVLIYFSLSEFGLLFLAPVEDEDDVVELVVEGS